MPRPDPALLQFPFIFVTICTLSGFVSVCQLDLGAFRCQRHPEASWHTEPKRTERLDRAKNYETSHRSHAIATSRTGVCVCAVAILANSIVVPHPPRWGTPWATNVMIVLEQLSKLRVRQKSTRSRRRGKLLRSSSSSVVDMTAQFLLSPPRGKSISMQQLGFFYILIENTRHTACLVGTTGRSRSAFSTGGGLELWLEKPERRSGTTSQTTARASSRQPKVCPL